MMEWVSQTAIAYAADAREVHGSEPGTDGNEVAGTRLWERMGVDGTW